MNEHLRSRKYAVVDKRKSNMNYLFDNSIQKSQDDKIDLQNNLISDGLIYNEIPNPPKHSNKEKKYCIETKDKVIFILLRYYFVKMLQLLAHLMILKYSMKTFLL